MRVWIITWEYSDKSAHGIVRVYDNKIRADDDLMMLKAQESARTFEMESFAVVEGK